jgi:chemotaxis protein methyltransferase CheR
VVSDNDFHFIRDLVRERSGIVLGSDKHYLVETRLSPLVVAKQLNGIGALVKVLREGESPLHIQVVELMATNETYFFRDGVPFEALHQVVMPMLAESRAASRKIAIWSAACSTGQEPYSIAMLLKEEFSRLNGWKIDILASDISNTVIDRARAGTYSHYEVSRGLPPHMLKYLTKSGDTSSVRADVRDMVHFSQLNLLGTWGQMPVMDVIFMRNVLIYFDTDDKKRVLNRVRQHLQPDGYLFLGGAETTLNLDNHFERVLIERAGCYRLRKDAQTRD